MDSKAIRTGAIIVVTAMILSVMPAARAAPPPAPAFWITPEILSFDTGHYNVGSKFNVTVRMSTLVSSYAWQVQIDFNVSQIEVMRADYTGSGKSMFFTGHATIPVTPIIDNTTGSVVFGESLVGSDSAAVGSGSLFWVEFVIMAAPVADETLTSLVSVDSDPNNTFILDSDSSSVPGVGMGFATYSLSYQPPIRDVAVVDLSFSNYRPKQGVDNVTIRVVVLNNGTIPETFDVTIALATGSPIVMLNVFDLTVGSNATLTYEWNTSEVSIGTSTITASATVVPSDIDPTNNEKSRPLTVISPTGPNTDLNGDGRVDMVDIAMVAHAFGTHEGDARWIQVADINGDGIINMIDVATVARDFGRM
jgi:hypothetical protein